MDLNRQSYIRIRQSLDLKPRSFALTAHLLKDLTLILIITALWKTEVTLAHLAAAPVLSILMFRGFSLMHDAVHGAVASNKTWNHFFGLWSGALSFLPYEQWRHGHLEHHFWSGNLEKDPVMGLLRGFPKFPAWLQAALKVGWKLWFPVISMAQHTVFWNLSLRQGLNRRAPLLSGLSLAAPILLWAALLTLTPTGFALLTALPATLIYLLGTEIINLPHHLQLVQVIGDKRFQVWNQHATARTCIYPEWFARNVVLNFNFHSAHHMFPDAPWYHLEKIHAAVFAEIGPTLKMDHDLGWTVVNRKRSFADVLYFEPGQEPSRRPVPAEPPQVA